MLNPQYNLMSDSSNKYPDIPQKLWKYFQRLLKEKTQHKLIEAIERQGDALTWTGINSLFRHASQATRMAPNKLYDRIGFKEKDFDDNNFQALLGILRAINMLYQKGFEELQPLPPKKSHKEVDLLGRFANKLFAIEIIRSSEQKYCYPDHNKPSSNPRTYIARRYSEKRPQLDSSIENHGCDAGMLVVIMDSQPFKALVTSKELLQVTHEAFLAMGSPTRTYLAVFTGMANEQGIDDCEIYPHLN